MEWSQLPLNRGNGAISRDLLLRRMKDTVSLSEQRGTPCFFGFLDEGQGELVSRFAAHYCGPHFMLWGGYAGAGRTLFGAFPNACEPESECFPVIPLYITFRKSASLSHRDFLGAFLSLGVERDAVGDILVEPGRSVVFVKQELASYFTQQLTKVGREGISFEEAGFPLPKPKEKCELFYTVASARLDCVVGAICGTSREKSKQLISSGLVSLNSVTEQPFHQEVEEGDILSIRKVGKFQVGQVGPPTKKGRLRLHVLQYQ